MVNIYGDDVTNEFLNYSMSEECISIEDMLLFICINPIQTLIYMNI